ncbi:hypothetical protein ACA910_010681 [Epithemia clementina (nom. ined.)]
MDQTDNDLSPEDVSKQQRRRQAKRKRSLATNHEQKDRDILHHEDTLTTPASLPKRRRGRRSTKSNRESHNNHDEPKDALVLGDVATTTAATAQDRTMARSSDGPPRMSGRSGLREKLSLLHQEMEVAQYARTKAGQLRRRVPRYHARMRTKKRKALESIDKDDFGHVADSTRQRLRGSRAAEGPEFVKASLVFLPSKDGGVSGGDGEEDEDDNDDNDEEDDISDEQPEENSGIALEDSNGSRFEAEVGDDDDVIEDEVEDGEEEIDSDANEIEDDDEDVDVQEDDMDQDEDDDDNRETDGAEKTTSKPKRSPNPEGRKRQSRRKVAARKKRLYRLRNFRSQRMAQRHGEALGAMVLGQSTVAIEKLKQVAKDAPSAPQIYSSLGMVYEDMLRGCQREYNEERKKIQQDEGRVDEDGIDELTAEAFLTEQIDIAKKAYGSYHISAILCKRDFCLWVRAADMALEIADLHSSVISLTHVHDRVFEYHNNERKRWLGEAKNDYQAADQLKPPGIDVPAKLAAILMDLGCLSEALTLMTDLKNRPPSVKGRRSEFETSFKAWVLYADLMLKVGHECEKWNSGDHSNENHTFRRWLRKWSEKFDWRERRLQSLTRALEAAAGTRCCVALLMWLQKRADTLVSVDTPTNEDEINDGEQDLELMERRCQDELDTFDKTTADLDLEEDSALANKRNEARKELVKKLSAEKISASSSTAGTTDPGEDTMMLKLTGDELPLRASVATVCTIAVDLMRLCLDCKLCDGGRLVGEAVSSYMKERASVMEKRLQARERFLDDQARPTNVFAFQRTSYDDVDADEKSTDSDEPMSDEDGFDGLDGAQITESFKRGILPPDLLFMYGLCLAGIGGHDYLASRCLGSLSSISQEHYSWLDSTVDQNKPTGTKWYAFRVANTGNFHKIQAFVFAADVLQALGKERRFCVHLVKLFGDLEEEMLSTDIIGKLECKPKFRCPVRELKIGFVVSSFAAIVRYRMYHLESTALSRTEAISASFLLRSLKSLSAMLPSYWVLNADKTISFLLISVLGTVGDAFHFLVKRAQTTDLDEVIRCIVAWLPFICARESMDLFSSMKSATDFSFHMLPFPWNWQSTDQYRLTLRCFNLAVARNVSYFSGWEKREFSGSPHQLRRRSGAPFYGITTADGCVAGYLTPRILAELLDQWELLVASGKVSPSKMIVAKLSALSSNLWYSGLEKRIMEFEEDNKIATEGEDDALLLLLAFSRISIYLAGNCSQLEHGIMNAMSVVLPLTQFCLNEQLWGCSVGNEVASRAPEEWQNLTTGPSTDGFRRPSQRAGYIRPSKRPDYKVTATNWFFEENAEDPLSNLIIVTTSNHSETWKQIATTPLCSERSAAEAMQTLHLSMLRLRKSFTEDAVQRAALQVAAALLELAMYPQCENGFLCLQHAALFAGQGSKEGNNDQYFKAPLPEKEICTPHEALLILGRADCFQSISFYREAAFLCGFVTSVCAMRRESLGGRLDSNWTIVSIAAYNTSVMIRFAALKLSQEQDAKIFECWDHSVRAELCLGRQEGKALHDEKEEPQLCLDEQKGRVLPDEKNGPSNGIERTQTSPCAFEITFPIASSPRPKTPILDAGSGSVGAAEIVEL